MKKLITVITMLIMALAFNLTEVNAHSDNQWEYMREYVGEYRWSGETYKVTYWVSSLEAGTIFIKYELENIEYDQLSISSNAVRTDKDFIHHEHKNIIMIKNKLFINTYKESESTFPYVIIAPVFESESERHTHISMIWIKLK